MSHEISLDHPGRITWFVGHGPATVIGPCPHLTCAHWGQSVIAWGPDLEHYELVVCDQDAGCGGGCRSWSDGRRTRGFLQVDPATEIRSTRENRRQWVPS